MIKLKHKVQHTWQQWLVISLTNCTPSILGNLQLLSIMMCALSKIFINYIPTQQGRIQKIWKQGVWALIFPTAHWLMTFRGKQIWKSMLFWCILMSSKAGISNWIIWKSLITLSKNYYWIFKEDRVPPSPQLNSPRKLQVRLVCDRLQHLDYIIHYCNEE